VSGWRKHSVYAIPSYKTGLIMAIANPLLNFTDLSSVLSVTRPTIKRYIATGLLKPVKLGVVLPGRIRDNRPVRFRIEDIASFAHLTVDQVDAAVTAAKAAEK
jgi:predicted DNA-binding transcriptional regulator AlpA